MIEQPAEYSYLFANLKGAKEYEVAFSQWKDDLGGQEEAKAPEFRWWG